MVNYFVFYRYEPWIAVQDKVQKPGPILDIKSPPLSDDEPSTHQGLPFWSPVLTSVLV